jgi:DNA-binding NarL/FixJ family response regulator
MGAATVFECCTIRKVKPVIAFPAHISIVFTDKDLLWSYLQIKSMVNCPVFVQGGIMFIYQTENTAGITGIDLCKKVKAKYPAIQVIALSINNQRGIIRKMIVSGASGYVLKDAGKHEIFEGVKAVMKGKTYFGRSVSEVLRKPELPAGLPALTRREKEVLELIADGNTNQEIADALFVDVTTIDFHRKNMLSKYKVKNTAALVKVAVSNKLI